MKKLIQRAFVVVATLLMAFAVAKPALADGHGKIVVADAGSETYTAYKIFDASKDETTGNIVYNISTSSPWLSVVYDSTARASKITGLEFTGPVDGVYTVEQVIGFDAADFANKLTDPSIPTGVANESFTTDSTTNTASTRANLDAGYYLVVSSADGTNLQDRSMLTTVLGLDEDEVVTIQNKNDMPLDKTYRVNNATEPFKESDVKIGDELYFSITGEVPNTGEYKSYTYILSDIMDEGLTFQNNLSVTIVSKEDGSTLETITPTVITDASSKLSGNEVRYNANDLTFELSINMMALNPTYAGAQVLVQYTAKVNEKAASVVSENNASLTYSNNPSNPTSFATKDTETKTYTSRIIVDKFESGAPEQKLSGAVFRLFKVAPAEGEGLEPGISMNADGTLPEGMARWYYIAHLTGNDVDNVIWTKTAADASTKTTLSDGSARFAGIKDGVYYLEEITAPDGYVMLTDPIKIEVDGRSSTTEGLTPDQVAYSLTQVANVANTPGSILPSTGGIGTTIFYAASMVVLAIIVKRFARSRRTA